MQYQHILVYLDDGASNSSRVKLAISLALTHGASLTGIVVSSLPGEGFLKSLGFTDTQAALTTSRDKANQRFHEFTTLCDDAGVLSETRLIESNDGRAAEKLARVARLFDLCVLRQANLEKHDANLVSAITEEVMLSSGRPVVCVPYIGAHEVPCKTAVIAWDGSRASTRAVHDALPLLEHVENVEVLVVNPRTFENFADHEPGDGLVDHLAGHGIKAKARRIEAGEISTSTAILNHLSDSGAGLLVMGGYGTPRLREVILGGVTQTLFRHMTVPVFMSH
ncbi:MAG: universal stress protein [Pseudomonadota bacterium]